jgi:hypothetical protein
VRFDRGSSFVAIRWAPGEQLRRHYRSRDRNVAIVGAWHLHPFGESTRPSGRDLEDLGENLDRVGGDAWIELIGSAADDWAPIRWDAWIETLDARGRPVVERATLVFG